MREEYYKKQAVGSKFEGKKWHHLRIQEVVNLVNGLQGLGSVLDIGAGDGTILSAVNIEEKAALEINPKWIEILKSKKDIEVLSGDILDPNLFAGRQFDIVMTTEVLEHFPYYDLVEVLKNIHRITKKYFVVCVPNPVSFMGRLAAVAGRFKWQQISLDHAFLADASQWMELFEKNGFKVAKFTGASMKVPKFFIPGLMVFKPIKSTLADFLIFLLEKK